MDLRLRCQPTCGCAVLTVARRPPSGAGAVHLGHRRLHQPHEPDSWWAGCGWAQSFGQAGSSSRPVVVWDRHGCGAARRSMHSEQRAVAVHVCILHVCPAVALMEGKALVATLFGGKPTTPDYENVRPAFGCLLFAMPTRRRTSSWRWRRQRGKASEAPGVSASGSTVRYRPAAYVSAPPRTAALLHRRCPARCSASRRWARWA